MKIYLAGNIGSGEESYAVCFRLSSINKLGVRRLLSYHDYLIKLGMKEWNQILKSVGEGVKSSEKKR